MKFLNKWMVVPYKPQDSLTVTSALSEALRKPVNPTEKIMAYNQVLNKNANISHPVVPKIKEKISNDDVVEKEKADQDLINTSVNSEPFLNYTLHRIDSDLNESIIDNDNIPMDISIHQNPNLIFSKHARPTKPPLSVSKLNKRIQLKPKRKGREVSPAYSPKNDIAITRARRTLEKEGYVILKNYKEYETPKPHNKVKIIEHNGWQKFK